MQKKETKKVGRPELLQPRSMQIKGSFTSQEYELIKSKAELLAITPGQYISKMAIAGKIADTYSPEQKERVWKLINLTNNMNQLAKVANTAGINSIVLQIDELLVDIRKIIKEGR
jgi:hypothetical protein